MAYTPFVKKIWKDEPIEETPIEASELNRIEDGITNLEASSIFYEVIGEINEATGEVTYYDTTQTVSSDTE